MIPRGIQRRVSVLIIIGLGAGLGVGKLLNMAKAPGAPVVASQHVPVPAEESPSLIEQANSSKDPIGVLLAGAPPSRNEPNADVGTVRWTTTPQKVDPDSRRNMRVLPPREAPRDAVIPERPKPLVLGRIEVLDAGSVRSGETVVRFMDVDALGVDAICTDARKVKWTCGRRAKAALEALIRQRSLSCTDQAERPYGFIARCAMGHQDIAAWLVQNGWARAPESSGEQLRRIMDEAKSAGAGQWISDSRERTAGASPVSKVR